MADSYRVKHAKQIHRLAEENQRNWKFMDNLTNEERSKARNVAADLLFHVTNNLAILEEYIANAR